MPTESKLRVVEVNRGDSPPVGDIVRAMYDGLLDVVVERAAFDPGVLGSLAASWDRPDADETWFRPNAVMPTEDIYILGTDTPATPTCRAPRGASLDDYLESALKHAKSASLAVGSNLNAEREIASLLLGLSAGRPVEAAVSADGRRYVPYTLRLLKEGKQISVHHDYHYPLPLYKDLSRTLDTATLISFFLTVQRPEGGGALIVYALNSDDPRQPVLPNGWWDLKAMEENFERTRFDLFPGDLVLLASGRRFHRVEPVAGPRARITLGGFLGLDKTRERVLYWS